ncbi:BLUF domain-containing protein [Sphingomonas turrisvirgatae]|uniref:Activator of photopigment and puc with BLUF domain protein n=1 Tax=Sphingomonas turrisvirgatae TaxID=1888892 RepID=A0A1E3LUB0_9SPHN|nr:BLUF domain-containing protein [Sphingomonas turrisvirgatae]ODP37338.1 activator of photopigment and puc with BLUF domain protein [Sphingomonas turrisvirgatae]
MFQLVYISSATPGETISMGNILTASRRNNTRDAITGLLYSNGQRFLQALEGPEDKVLAAMARIQADKRHRAVVVLSAQPVAEREFGAWAMAHHDAAQDGERVVEQVGRLVANASPSVKATFEGFCKLRRAA